VPHLKLMPGPNTYDGLQYSRQSLADGKSGIAHSFDDMGLLDNPILNSLETDHAKWAMVEGAARRYPAEVGPLSGMPDQSLAHYDALRRLAGSGGILGLFFQAPPAPPQGWSLVRGGLLTQMVATSPEIEQVAPPPFNTIFRPLTVADVPAMLELTELTEPGPFRKRTFELGKFYGAFESDRLVSMAGQRMSLPGFIEVSAVCTHPDARGRGYARILMSTVMHDILQHGRRPFLHAFADNPAIRLYKSLGFVQRRTFHLAVLKNEA
jgi:GNAT superfamily N-acetyltransferase